MFVLSRFLIVFSTLIFSGSIVNARSSIGVSYLNPYSVEGLAVGSAVVPRSKAYKRYNCRPSEQYANSISCKFSETKDSEHKILTILHLDNNIVTYVNKSVFPASFTKDGVEMEISRLSSKFGSSPRVQTSPNGIIATWGNIQLVPLSETDMRILRNDGQVNKGFLVDYLMNFQQSARTGLPIYSLAGGKGYVWVARFQNRQNEGALRFFAADPSQMDNISYQSGNQYVQEPHDYQQSRYEVEATARQTNPRTENSKIDSSTEIKAVVQTAVQTAVQSAVQTALTTEQKNRSNESPVQTEPPLPHDLREVKSVAQRVANLEAQISILTKLLEEQRNGEKSADDANKKAFSATISAINLRITKLRGEFDNKEKVYKKYLTSIKPNDRDEYITARKASELYPKIPYYISGTSETGEFWVEPTVTDKGDQLFSLKFIDTNSEIEKVRSKMDLTPVQARDFQKAIFKLHEWSEIAHKEKLRKNFDKRVICVPAPECPADGEQAEGKTSTEVKFLVYDDGSNAGRIQRNKGKFEEGYNFSIDSAMLLQAYLDHVIKEASTEYKAGTQSKKELNDLFK